jgi:hypothetical protein
MKHTIRGESYDTETDTFLCRLACKYDRNNDRWHDTGLYRTRGGVFFLAGKGNALSMWAGRFDGNCRGPGLGVRPVSAEEAREILERTAIEALLGP